MENRDAVILNKIIMYCDRIRSNLERFAYSYDAFVQDHMFRDACCMCVVQIGELASRLSDEAKSEISGVPWRIIKDTRNFYVHAYGDIDIPSVWETLLTDIPALRDACAALQR